MLLFLLTSNFVPRSADDLYTFLPSILSCRVPSGGLRCSPVEGLHRSLWPDFFSAVSVESDFSPKGLSFSQVALSRPVPSTTQTLTPVVYNSGIVLQSQASSLLLSCTSPPRNPNRSISWLLPRLPLKAVHVAVSDFTNRVRKGIGWFTLS